MKSQIDLSRLEDSAFNFGAYDYLREIISNPEALPVLLSGLKDQKTAEYVLWE